MMRIKKRLRRSNKQKYVPDGNGNTSIHSNYSQYGSEYLTVLLNLSLWTVLQSFR